MLRKIQTILIFHLLLTSVSQADFAEHYNKSLLFLDQGQYRLATEEAESARNEAGTNTEKSRALGIMGNLYLSLKQYDQAEKSLKSAMESASDLPLDQAGYANNLGILYSTLDKNRDTCSASCTADNALDMSYSEIDKSALAENFFAQAQQLAGDHHALSLEIKLNRLNNKPQNANPTEIAALFQELSRLPESAEKVRYTLNLTAIAKASADTGGEDLALRALEQSRTYIPNLKDSRLEIELLNSLADRYESKGDDAQALQFSEQASQLPTNQDIQDLLVDLEWRKGRIYQKQGRDDLSLAAYGKAVDAVQAVRSDIPVEYHEGHSSFRETLEPIYLGYAYQLLKKANFQDGNLKQKTLLLARRTVELIKQTEMEDFMGGRCFIEGLRHTDLDNRDETAATIYPIILPDRLELLVSFAKRIHQYTVPVSSSELKAGANRFAEKLRNIDKDYAPDARQLYQWLIEPMANDLKIAKIGTLVIVPDGVLRLVPFAALHDGRQYLVENFAIAVSPGMSLMPGGKADLRGYHTLLVGLSRPGGVVEKLPTPIVAGILNADDKANANQRSLRSLGDLDMRGVSAAIDRQTTNADLETLVRKPGAIEKLQNELSLPGVEDELKAVKLEVKNTVLLNGEFTVEGFRKEVADQPYEIIHMASHGVFTSDAETSFIMAYDNILKINDLQKILASGKPGKSLDLLTLSACETAEGDDRAPMGFTGVALRANAKSAIGSLWPIADNAAARLMGNFYKHLTQLHNKAEALRRAQLELLSTPKMHHPFFWSPFILVGNWI